MTQDVATNIPYEKLTLSSLSKIGFRTGALIKQGAFVKSWKTRYFSLTWSSLSYYEPQEPKIFISNIALNQCTKVVPVSEEKPYSFNLVCQDRVFIFLADTKRDRQLWVEALEAMIAINNPKLPVGTNTDVVKKIAFHVFRILHGTSLLCNTNKVLRDDCEKMCISLFALLRTFATSLICSEKDQENNFQELVSCCGNLKQAVLKVKQEIPPEHRILSEEVSFDMGTEDRRIRVHLKTLCRLNNHPGAFMLEDIEDDIKPFVLSVIKQALV